MTKLKVIEQTLFGTDEEIFRSKIITPQDFILMLVDIHKFVPQLGDRQPSVKLELEYVHDNKPRLIRYKRLYSLMKAYGMLTDLGLMHPLYSFINGDFITNDFYDVDPSLDSKLRESWEVLDSEPIMTHYTNTIGQLKPHRLREFFKAIMHYRLDLWKSTSYFSGYLAMGNGLSQAAYLVRQLEDMFIDPINNIIDETLLAFLSKDTVKPYSVGELIDKYGYPAITDKQLNDIDVDNF